MAPSSASDTAAFDPMPGEGLAAEGSSYTGILLVHGIGDERRNETLQEAVNALNRWFIQEASLDPRPDGPGRVWLVPDLNENTDPDISASRVLIPLLSCWDRGQENWDFAARE